MGDPTQLDARLRGALAEAVAIVWDEAQERPPLLRFLTPFGRPDLRALERAFRDAPSVAWLWADDGQGIDVDVLIDLLESRSTAVA